MSAEDSNKAIARQFFDMLNTHRLQSLDSVLDRNVVWHGTGGIGTLSGIDSYRRTAKLVTEAFPDARTVIEMIVAEGDKVAVRYTVSATHQSDFIGFPPTGEKVVISGNSIIRIAGEKIVEVWHGADLMGLIIANSPPSQQNPGQSYS
jgi:predicted ester cyclase